MLSYIDDFLSGHDAIFGLCHAGRLDDTRYGAFTPFVSADLEKRVDPAAVLPGAKSVVVAGFGHPVPFYGGEGDDGEADGYPRTPPRAASARRSLATLSSLGVNADYHRKIKTVLHGLAAVLKEKLSFNYKVLADSGTLDERALAVRAGLGFFGKNGTVISKKFGSFFNIGCLLTDIPPEKFIPNAVPAPASENGTGAPSGCPPGCRLCADACPGKAISSDGTLDCLRCASYLTQKDGELTEAEKKVVGRQLYGCDICREVCPFNKHVPRFAAQRVNPDEWLSLSDEALTQKYAHTAMAWRSAGILKRNAKAAADLL